jgi:hypothetical protein
MLHAIAPFVLLGTQNLLIYRYCTTDPRFVPNTNRNDRIITPANWKHLLSACSCLLFMFICYDRFCRSTKSMRQPMQIALFRLPLFVENLKSLQKKS